MDPDAKFLRVQVCPSCRFEANYSAFVPFLEKHGTCPMCDQEIVRTPHETEFASLNLRESRHTNQTRGLGKLWSLMQSTLEFG